jgi:hypothetical protein
MPTTGLAGYHVDIGAVRVGAKDSDLLAAA